MRRETIGRRHPLQIVGAIIAGGEAARLGGTKPFAPFAGATLLDAAVARIAPQVAQLVLNLRGDDAEAARAGFGFPILLDRAPSAGPLAGIIAALQWAEALADSHWLATVPADTPFLPHDLVRQLSAAARQGCPVYARDAAHAHYLCALWPPDCLTQLQAGFDSGELRSLKRAHRELDSVVCTVTGAPHAFFNVNTADDLAEAERLAAL